MWKLLLATGREMTYSNNLYADTSKPVNIRLAQEVPRRFLKPAVCKYPTTVNNSEIYILLPKPYPWMWHIMCGNRVRNGSGRKSETDKTCSLNLAILKIPIGVALRIHWTSTKDSDSTCGSAKPKRCAHHPCRHWFHSALCCTAHCP